jgi:hypothetical protein
MVRPKQSPNMQTAMSISISVRPLGSLEVRRSLEFLEFKNVSKRKFRLPSLRERLEGMTATGCSSANFYRILISLGVSAISNQRGQWMEHEELIVRIRGSRDGLVQRKSSRLCTTS